MRDAALLLLASGAAYVSFAWLALSQDRHWRRVAGVAGTSEDAGASRDVPAGRRTSLRLAASLLLLIGLILSLLRDGPGFGTLMWIGELSLAAYAVVITLVRWPHLIRRLPLAPR